MIPGAQTLPGVRAGWLSWGLVAFSVVMWRLLPFGWACALSLLALGVCALSARVLAGDARWLWRFALLPAATCAVLLLAGVMPEVWPCDVGCGGGAAYARVLGVPTVVAGLLGSLVIPAGALVHWRWRVHAGGARPGSAVRIPPLMAAWGWLMVGASVFFIVTALRLQMTCRQCGAFQSASLALAAVLWAGPLRLWQRALALASGAVLMLLCFGVAVREDVSALPLPPPPLPSQGPPPVVPSATGSEEAWRQRADGGRRWGDARARLHLELALDFQCPHCAAIFDGLMMSLQAPLARGELQIVVRTVVRPSQSASPSLATWSFAAAALGMHRRFVTAMLGSREGASPEQLLHGAGAQGLDLPAVVAAAQAHAGSCQQLVAADQLQLRSLGYHGQTPFAVLLDQGGAVRGRWSVSIDLPQLDASIHDSLGGR